ncbi:glycoside hydrolase family 113 [Luteibaculum oceani]|uniref:Glycoside hydrolase n=1 Tax=Luteibaculum oceani TaxID=1294296 RepID=A0A5C6VPV8_9FLAO|nr:hypothetical protein [Luteibaculum oceani]TXC85398.1 hypothetical protein FRX97_01875 [Luteibaculum oceani]
MIRLLLLSILGLILLSCDAQQMMYKGVSLVGSVKLPSDTSWKEIKILGANSITLMPYSYANGETGEFRFNEDWKWDGESYEGIDSCIKAAKKYGLTPIVKPHLWLNPGGFTGHHQFPSPAIWAKWFNDYKKYIVQFAELSEKHKLPLFCLANEMQSLWQEHPAYFEDLIASCRAVYSGKLVYASNWDEYNRFPYWHLLDYIGVNAYFPLESPSKAPTKWKAYHQTMNSLSDSLNLPVIFTEIGYRSIENPWEKPWESYTEVPFNGESQSLAWNTFFEALQDQDYVAGVFVWKWFPRVKNKGKSLGFSPQYKKAENTIKLWFHKL